VEATTGWSVSDYAATREATRADVTRSTASETAWSYVATTREAGTSIKARATVEAGTTVKAAAVEPGTRADEDATGEVARTVVTVRRASVWVLSIVAVGAYGSRTDIGRTTNPYAHSDASHSNTDRYPLCVRERRERRQGANQS
jgi:hypothetical protein